MRTLHNNYNETINDSAKKNIALVFCMLALLIVTYVLLKSPQPGVADQGDFDRVMIDAGLDLLSENKSNPNFHRFFDFTVSDYEIMDSGCKIILKRLKSMSLTSVITIISVLCKALGKNVFKTEYLAYIYVLFYIFAFFIVIKYLNIKNKAVLVLFTSLNLIVFLDGNYLVWFNSLYGEPIMITTFMLYISSWLYYIYQIYILKSKKNLFLKIMLIFITAFLFMGSKMQVLSALPVVFLMLCVLLWQNRKSVNLWQLGLFIILLYVLVMYPLKINKKYIIIKEDTQYNSVFYGVLKDSKTPQKDLISMGLNPDLAVDAGKHSYFGKDEYVKYVPHTDITAREFYSKMSSFKLAKFYITNPNRLLLGMKYTAEKAFITSTTLGKYPESYSKKKISEFNRFALWSSVREKYLPKNLTFIMIVYMIVLVITSVIYFREKANYALRAKLQLFVCIIMIGALQFPLPYIGNGHADISKQLYLFNFVFDIIIIVSICWCFDTLRLLYKNRKTK